MLLFAPIALICPSLLVAAADPKAQEETESEAEVEAEAEAEAAEVAAPATGCGQMNA